MRFFAVQVVSGREDSFIELFSKSRPDLIFHNIKKKMKIRRYGKLVHQVSCVFPGYLFFQYPDDKLSPGVVMALKHSKYFVRILPATDKIIPLSERDAEIIRQFVSFGKEIGPSLVTFDEKNRIRVIKGALFGLEGFIVRVDKRKRRVKVKMDLSDSPILFDLGFDILETIGEKTT